MLIKNASIETLTEFLNGYCGFIEESGRKTPARFTDEQLNYLKNESERFFNIARCTAGIHLAFSTDADEISFDYSIADAVYVANSGIDIYENGVFSAHHKISKGDANVHISYTRKATERSEIKLFFPAGVIFFPYNFSLGNALPLAQREKLAVFYGSSSSQSAYIHHPSFSWPESVSEFLDARYINRGIGSYYYDVKSLPCSTDCNPDYVFSMYGGNDILLFPTVDDALAQAEAFLSKLGELYPDAKIIVLSPEYMRREPMDEKIRNDLASYSAALPNLCRKYGYAYISTITLIPDLPTLFLEDNVHFNEAGMGQFTCNLINTLNNIK